MGFFDKLYKKTKNAVSSTASSVVKEIGKKSSDFGRKVIGKKASEALSKGIGEVKKHTTDVIKKGAQLTSQMMNKAENTFNEVVKKVPYGEKLLNKIVNHPKIQSATQLWNISKDITNKIKDGVYDPREIAETLVDNGLNSIMDKMPREVYLASKFI